MMNNEDRPAREVVQRPLRRRRQPRIRNQEPIEDEFEQQQAGRRPPPRLRSLNNDVKSFVTFYNTTPRPVVLYWIDYRGWAIRYGTLWRYDHLDVNTFVTHPWIFADKYSGDRFVVNHKEVYFPTANRPDRGNRTVVTITIPIYRLQDVALRVIAPLLKHTHQAYKLDIPKVLQYEVAIRVVKETIYRRDPS
ncbi:von Hippel-Lindau disease tumor suppressor-like [Augochlora pura]